MSEDEAFIRAVVDAPGGDLPRLVYADWLDDRADPRGPYLRAEREAVETGDAERLRGLSAGLDPVWVARVSRPPVGACCEHFPLERRWPRPPIGPTDLAAVERAHGVALPDSYRAFMLNYNGGVIPSDEFADSLVYNWTFYPLRVPAQFEGQPGFESIESNLAERRAYVIEQEASPAASEWYSRLLPVGHNPDYDSGILLGLSGADRGRVCVMHYIGGLELGYEDVMERGRCAASFPEFLSELPHWRLYRD